MVLPQGQAGGVNGAEGIARYKRAQQFFVRELEPAIRRDLFTRYLLLHFNTIKIKGDHKLVAF